METQNKTALDIVQELIAIHTTRKEAVDKLSAKDGSADQSKMLSAKQQSDHFISELLNELSTFGDAVQDSIERTNEYQQEWKDAFKNLDSIQPEDAVGIFEKLENTLKQTYVKIEESKELPDTLLQILSSQKKQLTM